MKLRKNTVLGVILFLFILLIGICVLEFASGLILRDTKLDQKVRYLEGRLKDSSRQIGCFDPYLGWGYRPGATEEKHSSDFDVVYHINSAGFREKEPLEDNKAACFRVIALGESNVFGEGVDYGKRFTEIIEGSLQDVEVINMGVRGFGADQSLLQLENGGFRFRPNTVILFVIRDFFERCKLYKRLGQIKPRFILSEDKKDLILQDMDFIENKLGAHTDPESDCNFSAVTAGRPGRSFLAKSSLVTFLNSKKRIAEIDKIATGETQYKWQKISEWLESDRRQGVRYNDNDFKQLIFLILERYKKICDRNSSEFVLIYIDKNKDYFSKFIADPVKKLKIDYLDLSGVLCDAANKESLTFNIDPHYNAFAHMVIGANVSDYLAKKYDLAGK
ncbi:MAG: hypothetical protein PHW98_04265 [Candidatus Omnitrophica bacterium]|nr:hypothetical protein [Candidatus Omnitrophota bacterium]MDD5771197.1 hypothetical protein [Candidatus Omnitrophota bacterium]